VRGLLEEAVVKRRDAMIVRALRRFSPLGTSLVTALLMLAVREPAMATPVFAQAYGLSCTVCHTQMPMLNAFGRYIQRTGYAALNPKALKHAVPVFVFDVGTAYVHQDENPTTGRITGPFHTTVVQANGAISPDFTYKIEQLVWAGGKAGSLDQTWIAYSNLFNHDGHLFVGKLAPINIDEFAASVLPEVNDAGLNREPNFAVGVHNYALDYDNGRWGAKFNYVGGKTLVQIAYLGNATGGNSFADAYDYSQNADRSVQWRIAYADPAKPYEVGVFGESGAIAFGGSALPASLHTDNYSVIVPYVSKDPRPGSPGFRFEYAMASDSNPGYTQYTAPGASPGPLQPAGARSSSWAQGSVYQMVLHDHGMVDVSYYHTNQSIAENGFTGLVGPAAPQSGGGPGFSYAINPYTRVHAAYYIVQNQRPAISTVIWFSPPLWPRLK